MLTLLSQGAQAELLKLIDERVAQQLDCVSPSSTDSPWVTVAEAADLLRTTKHAIYKRIKRGQLRGHRPDGSRILLRRDDLTPGPLDATVL